MKAIWCDGDLAQIDNVVSDESLSMYRDNMIIACKQNAARSGVEQTADLTKFYKLMHKLQRYVTVSDVPINNHPLKNRISKSFKNLQEEGRLCLKNLKIAHLIDFISSVPKMTAKAVTRNNIIHGFKTNGMINKKYEKFPDLKKILSTCKKNPTESDTNYVLIHFLTCLKNIWMMDM